MAVGTIIFFSIIAILFAVFCYGAFLGYVKYREIKENKRNERLEASNEEQKDINSNKVKVTIYEYMSKDLMRWVDEMIVEEKPDEVNNKLVMSSNGNFKEDFNFSIDRVFETLEYELNFKNKKLQEKESILNKAIEEQEKLVYGIKVRDENYFGKYNLLDSELKLRQLRVMKDCLRLDSKGNYVRIGKGGVREYELVVEDGILYPLHFGSRGYRVNPDLRVKKKVFNSESVIFKNEWGNYFNKLVETSTIILMICSIVVLILGGIAVWFAFTQISQPYQELQVVADRQASVIASINDIYGQELLAYLRNSSRVSSINTQEQNANNINTPNPNLNIGGVINVNPNQIG